MLELDVDTTISLGMVWILGDHLRSIVGGGELQAVRFLMVGTVTGVLLLIVRQ